MAARPLRGTNKLALPAREIVHCQIGHAETRTEAGSRVAVSSSGEAAMALKPCRECGAQVSTEAEVCPHCGVRSPTANDPLASLGPNDSKQNKNTGRRYAIAAIVILGIIALATWLPKSLEETTTKPWGAARIIETPEPLAKLPANMVRAACSRVTGWFWDRCRCFRF